jgi:hypothetical protein
MNKQFCTVNVTVANSIYSNIVAPAALAGGEDANGGASNLLANDDAAWFTTDIKKAIRPFNLTKDGEALTGAAAAGEEYNDNAYLLKLLRKLSEAAFTLSDSASNVLKELGDNAVYGQIGENSIETYEKRYGKVPITPYSSVFSIINSDMQLFATSGNNKFKQNYAIRAILDNLTLQKLPYTEKQLAEYNELAKSDEKLSDYETFVKNVNMAVNYYWEVRLKGKIVNTNIIATNNVDTASGALMHAPANAAVPQITSEMTNHWRNVQEIAYARSLVFKVLPNRGDVITSAKGAENKPTGQRGYGTKNMLYYEDFVTTVVEQSDREEYEKTLMNFYVDVSSTTSRSVECVQNIIDMNIVPFNIHMLMRDVPLINVYNYDYSFGKFVDEFLQTRKYNEKFNTMNTKQLFAELLKNPYISLSAPDNKFNLLRGIFIGDDALGMGRPKFLSDQLFNKCLLQSVYDDRANEEMRAINTSNHTNSDRVVLRRKLMSLITAITNFINLTPPVSIPSPAINAGPIPYANMGGGNTDAAINGYVHVNNLSLLTGQNLIDIASVTNADVIAYFQYIMGTQAGLTRNIAAFTLLKDFLDEAKDLDNLGANGVGNWGTDAATVAPADEHMKIYNAIVAMNVKLTAFIGAIAFGTRADYNTAIGAIPTQAELSEMHNILKPNGLLDLNITLQNAMRVRSLGAARALGGGVGAPVGNSAFYNSLVVGTPLQVKYAAINPVLNANKRVGLGFQDAGNTFNAGVDHANLTFIEGNIKLAMENAACLNKFLQASIKFETERSAIVSANVDPAAGIGFLNVCQKLSQFVHRDLVGIHGAANVAGLAAGFLTENTNTAKNQKYEFARRSDGNLSYVKEGEVVYKQFTGAQMTRFDAAYEYRFNSYLVRDLFFITNINRLLRQVFENELTGSREVVKHGYELANAGLTEYGQYPMKPNEISTSNQGNGLRRLIRDADSAEFYNSL